MFFIFALLGIRVITNISIIIVNYNAGRFLLDGVHASLAQAAEVIVVDNDSHDNSMALLEAAFPNEPKLLVHYVGKNLGFSAGCNIGFGLAVKPYVLFLNPDCVLQAGALTRMLKVLEYNPKIGMVGGLLTFPDGREQGGGRRAIPTPWRAFVRAFGLIKFSKLFPKLFFDFHLHKQPIPTKPTEVEAISGACMLVRREAVQAVGLWDEGYFLHCEDLDWCMRFGLQNWRILFVPDAVIVHQKGACSASRPVFVEWNKHKGMMRFYRKFFKEKYPAVLMWFVAVAVWFRFSIIAMCSTVRRICKI